MPTNPPGYMGKYYRKNKSKFNNPKEKAKRAERNRARRMMEKKGAVRKGDGRDVDHKQKLSNGGKTTYSNLRVRSRKSNRADNTKSRRK